MSVLYGIFKIVEFYYNLMKCLVSWGFAALLTNSFTKLSTEIVDSLKMHVALVV